MSIYDKASLVLIPSGTKTSKVYSQNPTNGDGDFTFSRSTAATRVNASGNIEKETQNLLLQSNQFDTTWSENYLIRTSGQAGYDGTNNAWLLQGFSGTAEKRLRQSATTTGIVTLSVYAKAGTINWLWLRGVTNSLNVRTFFDLSNGTIGGDGAVASKITDVGGGWYRCQATFNQQAGFEHYIGISDADGSASTSTTGNLYIQDAQLEQGLVARDYIETTTTAIYGGITDNVPRLDYTDSSCPALLLEPQRSNIIDQSEYFGAWTFGSGITLTHNHETSPEGLQNATLLARTTSGNVQQSKSVTSGTTYAVSVFAKAGTSNIVNLITTGTLNTSVTEFDLSDQSITTTTGSVVDSDIIDYDNGWYRCIITQTAASTGTGQVRINTGDNVNIILYGAQFEAGSYATSYIPTYGSAVTRNGESCIKTGISSLIGQTEGTLFLEAKSFANVYPTNTYTSITNSTGSNRILVGIAAQSNELRIVGVFGGVSNGGNNYTISDTTNYFKVAVKYYGSTLDVFINGEKKTSQSFGGYSNLVDAVRFDDGNGALPFEGDVKQRLIFPTALTDQEMIDLTTI